VERRDARKRNNPRSIDQTDAMLSNVDVKAYIKNLGVKNSFDTLYVTQLDYTKSLNKFLAETPLEDLKTLVRWDTFNSAANLLTTEIEVANWEFYSKYLRGAKKQRPANEQALATVNRALGEALGQLYVDAKFPPLTKIVFRILTG